MELITVEGAEEVERYLKWAYAAGFNEGKQQYTRRKPVAKFDLNTGEMIGVYESAVAAAKAHGLEKSTLCKAAKGIHEHAAGFRWEYLPTNSIHE